MNRVEVKKLPGSEARPLIEDLADLRMTVFREWPYLYEGSLDYERRYLETYLSCDDSLVVVVLDQGRCVGVSTVLPLKDAESAMQTPFRAHGMAPDEVAYFGESLLLPAYRGRGLGQQFFEHREAHAQTLGLGQCAFCAVVRPADHPARPPDYVPNDAFWTRRGYAPVPGLVCQYDWPDVGDRQSTSKTMQFWIKSL